MTRYLRLLLDHSTQCEDENCPSHARLREICGIIRQWIFSGPPGPGGHESPPLRHAEGDLENIQSGAAIGKS
jgi:hypothetical protein